MDTLADTEDVPRVLWVPSRGRVAHVCACGEEHLEGDVGGLGRITEDIFRIVGFLHGGAEIVEFASWKMELC